MTSPIEPQPSGPHGPRFKLGDRVKAAGPGIHRGKPGVVTSIVEPSAGDFVYRYQVGFSDESSGTFFGFELQSAEPLADEASV